MAAESLDVRVDPSELGFDAARLERIATHFDRYVGDERLPSWLVTVARAGELVWTGKGGYRDRELGLPVTDDTVWRIYSMTKPLTALAVMMLVEEGRVTLLDDVGRWIEPLREARVFVGGTADAPETVPAAGPVRVHHLLTSTSGLTYGFARRNPVDEMYRNKGHDFIFKRGITLAQAVEEWCSTPLLFEPGTRFNYSVSMAVLGHLITRWTGQSLDEFFRERILDPLGMDETDWWCPDERQDRLAQLYVPFQGGSIPFEDIAKGARHWPSYLDAGGGLVSTAHDFGRFMTMLVRGGELDGRRLVSRRSVELMMQNHLEGGADLTTSAVDSYADDEYAGVGFGFGLSVIVDRRRNKTLASDGVVSWGGAASTFFWVDPEEELSVAFYTQLLPPGTYPLRREMYQLVYQALVD